MEDVIKVFMRVGFIVGVLGLMLWGMASSAPQ